MPRQSRMWQRRCQRMHLLSVCQLASAEVASNGKHCLWRVTSARRRFISSAPFIRCSHRIIFGLQ